MPIPIEPVSIGVTVATEAPGWIEKATKLYERFLKRSTQDIVARPAASDNELRFICKMLRKQFEREAPDLQMVRAMQAAHPEHFWVVVKTKEGEGTIKTEIVGTFKVLRANRAAVELLNKEELTGTRFKPEHFASPDETPEAIYIGDVVGKNRFLASYRTATMIHLVEFLKKQEAAGVPYFYSRPLTKDGLLRSQQADFRAVISRYDGEFDHIYRRDNQKTQLPIEAYVFKARQAKKTGREVNEANRKIDVKAKKASGRDTAGAIRATSQRRLRRGASHGQ